MLGQYNEAIICADKALEVDPKHCSSLQCEGACLKLKKQMYDLIQHQKKYQEALIFYEQALKINPNDQWTKDRKDQCLKALNKK